MTTTIADFEQQLMERAMRISMQKSKPQSVQEGMQEKAREIARRMLGDGKPEWEVRQYTDLSSEEIRQIKREIENSKDRTNMTTTIADFEQQLMERAERRIQESIQEGRKEGIQEGRKEGKLEIARLMLGDGKPEQEVRRYTNLSTEEISQIKGEIENSMD